MSESESGAVTASIEGNAGSEFPGAGKHTVSAGAGEFGELLEEQRARIFKVLVARTGDVELARDLTQECLMKALVHRDAFRGHSALSTWLIRIALNLVYDLGRRARSHAGAEVVRLDPWRLAEIRDHRTIDAERCLIAREGLRQIERRLSKASDLQRRIFDYRFCDGMSIAEIASRTGRSASCVRSVLYRLKASVRGKLIQPESEGPATCRPAILQNSA